jgi:glutamate synthase domain-containing protein 3
VEINLVEDSTYRKELHELIRQHYLYTGSKLARTMLDDWNHYVVSAATSLPRITSSPVTPDCMVLQAVSCISMVR